MSTFDTDPDRYLVALDGPQIETKVKGSRFLAQLGSISDQTDAKDRLTAIRKKAYDATHHCWALRTGHPESMQERSDDDGEPSGTAGLPILGAIHSADLFDVLVVVTRYYGGTKLGTGGLARAYGDAARQAVAAAPFQYRWRTVTVIARSSFDDMGTVETILGKSGASLRDVVRDFDPQPSFALTVKQSRAEALLLRLREATAGRVHLEVEES